MYVINCRIKMITESEGKQFVTEANGLIAQLGLNSWKVNYHLDGDEASISFSRKQFAIVRNGKTVNISAVFSEGERTEMLFGESGQAGSVPLTTRIYKIERTESGFQILLCYDLLFPNCSQSFRVQTFVIKSEEK